MSARVRATEPARTLPGVLGRLALLGALATGFLLLAELDVTLCPFANLTGHPCPGCGLTRAALALSSGNLREAVHFHPLAPVLVPLGGVMLVEAARRFVWPASFADVSSPALVAASPLGSWLARHTGKVLVLATALLLGVWVGRFFGYFGGPVPVGGLITQLGLR